MPYNQNISPEKKRYVNGYGTIEKWHAGKFMGSDINSFILSSRLKKDKHVFRIILQESNFHYQIDHETKLILKWKRKGIKFGMTIRIHGKEIAHPNSQNVRYLI